MVGSQVEVRTKKQMLE